MDTRLETVRAQAGREARPAKISPAACGSRRLALLLALVFCPAALNSQMQVGYPGTQGVYAEGIYQPAVTTSPWAPAWSPDGRTIAFSMLGSLWKMPIEGGEAIQITSGTHYDSEPTWSPDGQKIAFTRDTGRTIEIWVVSADGGEARQLTRSEAVSINPAWSPDGKTILYTSTAGAKTHNLWLVPAAGGQPQALLVDEFQNTQPSWSPDGKHIVFLSNRDVFDAPGETAGRRFYGTGDIWRLTLADKSLKMLLKEDTLYHTRPRWSPDGKKVVFISHRTGHNEVWMMHADTGVALQLTRQPAEVFHPVWSPDGRRIAFVSNEGHKFTLKSMPGVGGSPRDIVPTGFKYRSPIGRLEVTVKDAGTGKATGARVYLRGSDGKSYSPLGAFHRVVTVTIDHYFHTPGEFGLDLPAGRASVEVMKGFEYRPQKREVSIVPGQTQKLEFALERIADLPALGWYSGDSHVHMNYGGIFGVTPEWLLMEAEAEDLNVTNSLITNHNNRIMDLQYFEGKPNAVSNARRIIYFNQEFRPNLEGHLSLLNLREYVFPVYKGYVGTPYAAPYPTNSQILDRVHEQGGIGGFVHPFYATITRRSKEFPVTTALGKLDFYDLLCIWSDEYLSAEEWYRALNLGFRIPASAGSDAFPNFWRSPAVGTVRAYVYSGTPLTYGDWIRGLTAGRTFVTNGPLLFFRVDGREPGDEIRLGPGQGTTVPVEIEARSIVPMEKVDIIQNGKVVFTVKASDPYQVKVSTTVVVERSGWIAARATGPEKQRYLMDSYVYAHTSPVYLIKGGMPARSPEDARYFIQWIDETMVLLAKQAFDTREQREEVLGIWRKARQVYVNLAQE